MEGAGGACHGPLACPAIRDEGHAEMTVLSFKWHRELRLSFI